MLYNIRSTLLCLTIVTVSLKTSFPHKCTCIEPNRIKPVSMYVILIHSVDTMLIEVNLITYVINCINVHEIDVTMELLSMLLVSLHILDHLHSFS